MEKQTVLYRHVRLDKNVPFYIGIGKLSRAYTKFGRNKIWNHIVKKTAYRVDILFDDLTWDEATEKEKEFIQLYGRIDQKTGTLCNLTIGGDGMVGIVRTKESREQQKKALKKRWESEEYKSKLKDSHRARFEGDRSLESKQKMSKAALSRKGDWRKKHSEAIKLKFQTDPEYRVKISNASKGRVWINNGFDNKMITETDLNSFLINRWNKGRVGLPKRSRVR